MVIRRCLAISLVLVSGCFGSLTFPKEKDRNIALSFVPQESTGTSAPVLAGAQAARPVALRFEDGRVLEDKTVVGDGTGDDDDERFAWRTSDDVPAFAEKILRELVGSWGIQIKDDADLVLSVRLAKFMVSERDQAVGSTYMASVNVAVELSQPGGEILGQGVGSGDARRYGRKRSAENCMEVLSDAMQEAYAAFLSQPEMQKAWSGEVSRVKASGETPDVVSPEALLREVVKLAEQGFGAKLLADYVKQKTISRSFTPEDLLSWKSAGVDEEVIAAALERSKVSRQP